MGTDLGMLVGPRGTTLSALQDLTRAVVQRQCPSRTDRILVDVAGYREKRSAALKRFSVQIAEEVMSSGQEKALEAMSPADRKSVHDAINETAGVVTRLRVKTPIGTSSSPLRADDPSVPGTDDQGDPSGRQRIPGARSGGGRELGFFGPGPLEPQVRHARGFVVAARPLSVTATPRLVDMGAGGGLPGLVVAQGWPEASLVLLEANERRCAFLRRAVDQLELGDRVSVLQERAEIWARSRVAIQLRRGDRPLVRQAGRAGRMHRSPTQIRGVDRGLGTSDLHAGINGRFGL